MLFRKSRMRYAISKTCSQNDVTRLALKFGIYGPQITADDLIDWAARGYKIHPSLYLKIEPYTRYPHDDDSGV